MSVGGRSPDQASRAPTGTGGPAIGVSAPGWACETGEGFTVYADQCGESALGFALSVAAGLDDRPRWLDSRYLYDDEGCRIFDQITRQPEYYQTRVEDQLLATHAAALRQLVGPTVLVELGSGASTKTEHLLDAWTAAAPTLYVPLDVSRTALAAAARVLHGRWPGRLTVQALAAAYERGLPLVRDLSPKVIAFLGSSIGNLGRHQQDEFLELVASTLQPGDFFLVGLDLAHDPSALEAAYNDAAGWSAAFTRNLFARMNRELGCRIPLDAVEHVALYDGDRQRIEIYAELQSEVRIDLPIVGRSFRLARGERIRTEVSQKFGSTMTAAIERHGMTHEWQATEPAGRFALRLFRRDAVAGARTPAPRLDAIEAVRQRTLAMIAPVSPADLERQHNPLMSPVVWDLGHIADFEDVWLVRRAAAQAGAAGRGQGTSPPSEEGLDPLYDPTAVPRDRRGQLPLPTTAQVLDRLAQVRRAARAALVQGGLGSGVGADGPRLLAHGHVVHMVAQHEAQHQETILQALNLRADLPYQPPHTIRPDAVPSDGAVPCPRVLVPGGPSLMGTDDQAWAYDNERPMHAVDLPAFWIDAAPVTAGEYLRFVQDGGYRRAELWAPEGWAWCSGEGVQAPLGWQQRGDRWLIRSFGRLRPLDPRVPVVHVSWHEADAFARWAGKRLPTEAEWEKAAGWDRVGNRMQRHPWGDHPGRAVHANLDQRHLEPMPVGSYPAGRSPYGCVQMLGDVWEWTSSWFQPYPGFRSFPYREYSEIFFGHSFRVLRGGAFATSDLVARTTFRNWDYPQRRHIFAGFRCAEDA